MKGDKKTVPPRRRLGTFVRRLWYVLIILLVTIGGFLGFFLVQQKKIIQDLERRIEQVKTTTIPLRFMVLSRSDEEISARFKFYSADGKEIASFERAWKGSELAIDTLVVPLKGQFLAFPVRVFTDAIAPNKGTLLFPYYDRDGMPAIFDSPTLDRELRLGLRDLFGALKRMEQFYGTSETQGSGASFSILGSVFGNAVHDIHRFWRFDIGTVYDLVVHPDGGIEILPQ